MKTMQTILFHFAFALWTVAVLSFAVGQNWLTANDAAVACLTSFVFVAGNCIDRLVLGAREYSRECQIERQRRDEAVNDRIRSEFRRHAR